MKTQNKTNDDLTLKDLNQYYGTEQYHNINFGTYSLTDGIIYLMKNGYSWFVTDFISVGMNKKEIQKQEFVAIKLKIKDNKAEMIVTDGNEKILYTQKYEWTNAKKEFNLYLTNNVLMLSGEY